MERVPFDSWIGALGLTASGSTRPQPTQSIDAVVPLPSSETPQTIPPGDPVALHLFSGPSHPRDLSAQMAKRSWKCIDVDIKVADKPLSAGNDLTNDEVWEEARHMVERGLIQGVHIGPPCSTCSHARPPPPVFPPPNQVQSVPPRPS